MMRWKGKCSKMNDRFTATLALCMRAKKLTFGFETVKQSVQSRQAFLLLTALDISPKTEKEVAFLAGKYGLPHQKLAVTMRELGGIIGKTTGVLAVTEPGLAKKLSTVHYETEDTNL